MKYPCIYILTDESNGTLYIGVTGNLHQRMGAHREAWNEALTTGYTCSKLVYVERFARIFEAIQREKELKSWERSPKVALIESVNPQWRDLSFEIWSEAVVSANVDWRGGRLVADGVQRDSDQDVVPLKVVRLAEVGVHWEVDWDNVSLDVTQ